MSHRCWDPNLHTLILLGRKPARVGLSGPLVPETRAVDAPVGTRVRSIPSCESKVLAAACLS